MVTYLEGIAALSDESFRDLEWLIIDYDLNAAHIEKKQKATDEWSAFCWWSPGAVIKPLVSLGNQLEWAFLYEFKEEDIRDVSRTSKNARFEAYTPDLLARLNLLGDQLESITACNKYEGSYMNLYTASWNRDLNLQELDFR